MFVPSRIALAAAALAAASSFPQTAVSYDSYNSYDGGSSSTSTCGSGSFRSRLEIVGLTSDGRLICFNEFSPGDARNIGLVLGLSGGDTALVGIDYRVQDRKLYGVGNAGGIYTIDAASGLATPVNRLSVTLSGTSFGVDFNPAADRLRIISNTGQNLRHNLNDGVTAVDGTLTHTVAPLGTALDVTGAAYTNNDLDASTATTLYDLDTARNQITIQSPANAGMLAPTGSLTVDATSVAGFDIYSTIRNGVTVDVMGFAALTVANGGPNQLYRVTLFTGKAQSRGNFSSTNVVVDIAIPLNQL